MAQKFLTNIKYRPKGYEIRYRITSSGFGDQLSGDHLSFQWQNILKPMEKDLADTRIYSTITYYSETDGFDELGARSTDTETEIFGTLSNGLRSKRNSFSHLLLRKIIFQVVKLRRPSMKATLQSLNVPMQNCLFR